MRFNIKHLLAIIILIFSFSCQNEEFQNLNGQANYKEAVWEYNGDSKVIKNVITEMRNVSDIGVFEKNIGQKDLVWEKPKFLVVNKDRKILIPLLNRNKNRVVGVLSLYKDKGNKTNYNLTMRSRLYKNDEETVPFWTKSMWKGYLLALDKDLFNIKNGSPGFSINKLKKEEYLAKNSSTSKSSTWECEEVLYEHCYDWYSQDSEGNEEYLHTTCSYEYHEECFYVVDPIEDEDPYDDEDCYDETNPDCINYDPCIDNPCACGDCGNSTIEDDDLFDDLDKTCQGNKIKNYTISTNTSLTNFITGVFFGNSTYNLQLSDIDISSGTDLNANTRLPTSAVLDSNNGIVIEFDNSYLDNATNLSIAMTTGHEFVHVYLSYLYIDGELLNYNSNYTDLNNAFSTYYNNQNTTNGEALGEAMHDVYDDFLDMITDSVFAYATNNNISVSRDYCEKLVLGAHQYTNAFNGLTPAQQTEYSTITFNEENNNASAQGTSCED